MNRRLGALIAVVALASGLLLAGAMLLCQPGPAISIYGPRATSRAGSCSAWSSGWGSRLSARRSPCGCLAACCRTSAFAPVIAAVSLGGSGGGGVGRASRDNAASRAAARGALVRGSGESLRHHGAGNSWRLCPPGRPHRAPPTPWSISPRRLALRRIYFSLNVLDHRHLHFAARRRARSQAAARLRWRVSEHARPRAGGVAHGADVRDTRVGGPCCCSPCRCYTHQARVQPLRGSARDVHPDRGQPRGGGRQARQVHQRPQRGRPGDRHGHRAGDEGQRRGDGGPGVGRPPPRHRQDRRPGLGAAQAGAAHPRGSDRP